MEHYFKKHHIVDRRPDARYQSIEIISLLENVDTTGPLRDPMLSVP
jgi:hypothetical protein